MLMAGTLPALTTLAAANGLYLVLLLLGGMVVPLDELGGLEPVAKLLPSGALSEAVHGALEGTGIPASAWLVLPPGRWSRRGRGLALPLGLTRSARPPLEQRMRRRTAADVGASEAEAGGVGARR